MRLNKLIIFAIFVILFSSFTLADLGTGLLRNFTLDIGTYDGTTIIDSSGIANATNVSAIIPSMGIIGNGSYHSDGEWNTPETSLLGLENFTLDGWLYATILDSEEVLADYYNSGGGEGFYFGILSNNSYRFYTSKGTLITGIATNESWIHFTAVKNITNQSLWINGVMIGSISTSAGVIGNPTENLYFGKELGSENRFPFYGYLDEIKIYNRALSENEILLLNQTTTTGTIVISETLPATNTQFGTSTLNINTTINASSINTTFNCSLYLNGAENYTWTNQLNSTTFLSVNRTLSTPSTNTYYFNCTDGTTETLSSTKTFYLDIVNPAITSNFTNGTIYYLRNVTGQFNLTDDFLLYSYNISIDGTSIDSATNLNTSSYSYNLSYDPSGLSVGTHTLTVRTADGHTAHKIPDYAVTDGIFNNKLTYTFQENDWVTIEDKDSSIFSKFTTEKKVDRYNFNYEPSNKKSKYTFIVTSKEQIEIIKTDCKYQEYLIIGGKHWLDFVMEEEQNHKVKIKQISDYEVEVDISGITKSDKLKFSSIGDLNIVEQNFTFIKVNATFNYLSEMSERTEQTIHYIFNITNTNLTINDINATLMYNNSLKSLSKTSDELTYINFTSTFYTPEISGTSEIKTFNWTFNNIEELQYNQTLYLIAIDDCTNYTGNFINFSVYDETSKTSDNLLNVSIEVDLNLSAGEYSWVYNTSKTGSNLTTLSLCLYNFSFENNNFTIDSIARYKADDHATEFYYLQEYPLSAGTFQDVKLYTLNTDTSLAEYSTSFLINFQNKYFINSPDVIIDLARYYIPEGKYVSVEHGLTDDSGNTILHLVTEEVKYQITARRNNEVLYQSSPFLAICLDSPCQINFQEDDDLQSEWDYLDTGNLNWNLNFDEDTRTTTLTFSTIDGSTTTANLKVTRLDNYMNSTICDENSTTSSGTISCIIPQTARNATYIAEFGTYDAPYSWMETAYLNLNPNSLDVFGYTGIIMTILLTLTLVLMSVQSGVIAVIFFAILGLIIASLLVIFTGGSIFGLGSSLIWLIVAGGVIIWKASSR